MPTLELTAEEAIGLIEQLAPGTQADILARMASRGRDRRMEIRDRSEQRIREECKRRGLDWDSMDDEARQDFIEDWLDEGI